MIVSVRAIVDAWKCLQCGWVWAHGRPRPARCANPACRKLADWVDKKVRRVRRPRVRVGE